MAIRINAPLTSADARKLKSGDSCLISGVIYIKDSKSVIDYTK